MLLKLLLHYDALALHHLALVLRMLAAHHTLVAVLSSTKDFSKLRNTIQ